ncbi:type II toxin-antitoxin system RelE/ParE family toxin [Alcanivoracaceae bacterium MT1]
MAVRIEWAAEALDDVDDIAEYISKDSPFYAKAVVKKIRAMSLSLADFPERGRIVPEWGAPDIRERFAYSYRLIYRVSAGEVGILAVIHSRRQLESIEDRVIE